MSYLEIVSLIMTVLGVMMAVFTIQYVIIFITGIFAKRKKFPAREEKLRYGVIIAARNEEDVIANLIQSIQKSNYPQDKLDIFVIAHNCNDKTAQNARDVGVFVYEYNNPQECTKGYALKHIFQCIQKDYGIMNYDGFIIFDADNVLDSEFFNKINDAFLYYDRQCAITTFRNAKNFGTNNITACYGIMYIGNCSVESNGRMLLNCSSRILGSGFLVSSEMVKDGWNIVNLSDDTDFTAEQVLEGKRVMYCDEAMYYDEHPTTFKAMWRQRLRWAKGTLVVCKKRLKDLLKSTFGFGKRKDKNEEKVKRLRGSSFDLICVTLPIGVMGIVVFILHIVLLAFMPLCGEDIANAWILWAIWVGGGFLLGYIGLMICAIICYVEERKRIKNVPLHIKISSVFLWPFFALLLAPLQVAAIFTKKFVWKQIVHNDTSNFETFNNLSLDSATAEGQKEEEE